MPGITIYTDGTNYFTQRGAGGGSSSTLPAPSFVQGNTSGDYASHTSIPVAFTSNNLLGSMLLVFASNAGTNAGTVTISDTQGNSYLQLFADTTISGLVQVAWYALNAKAGANTVTVSWSTGAANSAMIITEYSGIRTLSALDQSGLSTGNSTAWSSPSKTTTANGEILIGIGVSQIGSVTINLPFSSRFTIKSAGNIFTQFGDDINVNAGTYQATGSTASGLWIGFIATFRGLGLAPPVDTYVLGTQDLTQLPNSVANPSVYYGPDAQPNTAGSLDDEFNGSTLNTTRWTWQNQGTATVTVANSAVTLHALAAAGTNAKAITQPAPATPWEVTAKISLSGPLVNFTQGGLILIDGVGKAVGYTTIFDTLDATSFGPTGQELNVDKLTNLTTFSANYNIIGQSWTPGWFYLRIRDDGTNLIFNYSTNGIQWIQQFSVSRIDFLSGGPSLVGLQVDAAQTTGDVYLSCDWFRRTL